MEEVFEQLRCSREGLTSEDGEERLKVFGLNKLEEVSVSLVHGCVHHTLDLASPHLKLAAMLPASSTCSIQRDLLPACLCVWTPFGHSYVRTW